MNWTLILKYVARIVGYGLTTVAAPALTMRYGAEAGGAAAGVGGFILHKATQEFIPRREPKP